MQERALSMTYEDWIGANALAGGILGGAAVAISAVVGFIGPGALIAVSGLGLYVSVKDFIKTVEIILYETGSLTTCTAIRLLMDTAGIVLSTVGIIHGVRAWRASGSLLRWEKPIARDIPGEDGASTGRCSGRLEKTNVIDPNADQLAVDLGGESRVKFSSDPNGVEFDVVSDQYIGQVTERTTIGSVFRKQARTTFEAAQATGRSVYYRFLKTPSSGIINKLNEYSRRYLIEVVIEIMK